jgi:hypothetical protein
LALQQVQKMEGNPAEQPSSPSDSLQTAPVTDTVKKK